MTGKERVVELFRWVGVLPAAYAAWFVGHTLTYALVIRPLMSGMSYEGNGRWVRHLVGGFLSGTVFVVAGALLAPRFRPAIALLLAAWAVGWAVLIHREDYIPIVAAAVPAVCGVAIVLLVCFFCQANRPAGPS